MAARLKIKKILSEEEFLNTLENCKKNSQEFIENKERLYSQCQRVTKEITPADEVYLLTKVGERSFEVFDLGITIDLGENDSALKECLLSKNTILIQDASRSFTFNPKIDNFSNSNIKSLLLIPIISSESKELIGIIWASILRGNINQYTQKDIDYMKRLSQVASRYMILSQDFSKRGELNDIQLQLNDCINTRRNLELRLKKEEEYFAAIIHDVRSPMNAVVGFLELLKIQESDQQKIKYIDSILESVNSVISLTSDALDIAKISSGKMTIEKKIFSPLHEFAAIARLFFAASIKKQISFFAYYDPSTPSKIMSDYHRIKQIINNLLSNALKFTDRNGKIILRLEYIKDKDGLYISVEDTGIGIAKERQKQIFTPYTQESSDISHKYGGTGLGLSISHQLSILLGGKLQLESEKGEGSKFYFMIPCNTPKNTPPTIQRDKYKDTKITVVISDELGKEYLEFLGDYLEYMGIEYRAFDIKNGNFLHVKDDDILIIRETHINQIYNKLLVYLNKKKSVIIVKDGSVAQYPKLEGKVAYISAPILPHDLDETISQLILGKISARKELDIESVLSDRRVMVVDDNPINLTFMKELLKKMGANDIYLAQNGERALNILKENGRFDIIFVDQNMPKMDGSELIKHIRELEGNRKYKPITIIGLTGDSTENTTKSMEDAGADDVLVKPIRIKKLLEKIKELGL